jgi:hypothetical protein
MNRHEALVGRELLEVQHLRIEIRDLLKVGILEEAPAAPGAPLTHGD